ncbi:hypothetical protein V1498_14445 [Peribacillus sp. SCS-26]|uniref:hypothetical protein n=1 Tax=Paraperibacillus marinus TaxID=3115295 RepID=UPI003905C91E
MQSGIIQAIVNRAATVSVTAASFRTGQVVLGTVSRLYPNQTAEVRIGQTKLTASIDAPLQAGKSYWFQVDTDDAVTKLRILESKLNQGAGEAAQLVKLLGLPPGKESISIAAFLLKKGIPIHPQSFGSILSWARTSDDLKGTLEMAGILAEKNLPITEKNLSAIFQMEKGKPLHSLLAMLESQLGQEPQTSKAGIALKEALASVTGISAKRMGESLLNELAARAVSGGHNSRNALQVLQGFGFLGEDKTEQALHIGKQAELETSVPDPDIPVKHRGILLQDLNQKTVEEAGEKNVRMGQNSVQAASGQDEYTKQDGDSLKNLRNLLPGLMNQETPQEPGELAAALGKLMSGSQEVPEASIQRLQSAVLSYAQGKIPELPAGITSEEGKWLFSLMSDHAAGFDFTKGDDVKSYFKQIIYTLGLDHLVEPPEAVDTNHSMIKQALSAFLDGQESSALSNTAEQILQKLNAQSLLSNENGPLQNLVMQFPMPLNKEWTDATIQWNGRKKEDGSIDADYCRVLFYLELSNLKGTVIDMQVQSRIVKLTIFNEQNAAFKESAKRYVQPLRSSLQEMDYTLSSINFISPPAEGSEKKAAYSPAGWPAYSGVDIRI